MLKNRPVIIDTDPGIDDAVAIAIALSDSTLDVKLITTVAGNVGIDKVTVNALKLLTYYKKVVPIAKGAAKPLMRENIDAADIHGPSGLEGWDFDEPNEALLLKDHAVNAMRKVIMESEEKVTLVPIGPLTNIALLLCMYPEVKDNIAEIALMGGSLSRGNKGVMAEFNIACDPEAAKIVFESKLPIAVAPLDVGLKALVYPEDSEKLKDMNDVGKMVYSLFKKYRGGSMKTGLKMYDSCAVAYLTMPEMFTISEVFVDVETKSELTAGCTVIDVKGYLNKQPNAKVCTDIDADMFKKWFMQSLENCN